MRSESTATRHTGISSEMSSTRHILSPQARYHVPGVFLKSEPTLTHKVRSTAHGQFKTRCNTCVETAGHHISTQQSHQETLVPFASLPAISGTFNSLFKVLFTFPSRYLFAIGLESIFSFRRKLPPILRSTSKERDSMKAYRTAGASDETGFSPSLMLSSKKTCARVRPGMTSQDYNSQQAGIYSLSSSRFIRHY